MAVVREVNVLDVIAASRAEAAASDSPQVAERPSQEETHAEDK